MVQVTVFSLSRVCMSVVCLSVVCVCVRVEVDTVDGFQGREMDCIIVSCVRASNKTGSIGYAVQHVDASLTRLFH